MPVALEICVDTLDGLDAACAGGADRIELCSALALGGLTPSAGALRRAAGAPVPVVAMIRPRAGDFVYGDAEADAMRHDIDEAASCGLAGVVIGALDRAGGLDASLLERLVTHARARGLRQVTLHRAFDLVARPAAALEQAVALGFSRILTSGTAVTAAAGAETIAALVGQAGTRITIMAGAGLTPGNAPGLVRETGVREVHASCRVAPEPLPGLGFETAQPHTSMAAVRALRAALDG